MHNDLSKNFKIKKKKKKISFKFPISSSPHVFTASAKFSYDHRNFLTFFLSKFHFVKFLGTSNPFGVCRDPSITTLGAVSLIQLQQELTEQGNLFPGMPFVRGPDLSKTQHQGRDVSTWQPRLFSIPVCIQNCECQ